MTSSGRLQRRVRLGRLTRRGVVWLRGRSRRQLLAATGGLLALGTVWVLLSLVTTLQTPTPSTLVTDRQGRPLSEVAGGDGNDRFGYWPLPWVMPMRLAVATTETEDRRFYEHGGVSPQSLLRALRQNLSEGRVVSGASTIAMQVARMQSNRRRTMVSKGLEALEALVLVRRYGHDAILRQYLTLAPYGARIHGAERAARFYFDKPAEDLSWLQASWLAGLPQQPTRLGPFVDGGLQRGLKRAHRILGSLHDRGYLSDDEWRTALESDLALVDRRPRPESALHFSLRMADDVRAARRRSPGLTTVRTTLDLDMQTFVQRVVSANLDEARPLGASNGCALVVDTASGEVLSWVGSADYFDDDAHGAIDYLRARRSPGSTLKPFLYALATDPAWPRAITAATPLADLPMDVVADGGRSYVPKNLNRTFLGPMSARESLGNSRNIPALRVLGDVVGVERALGFFGAAGVENISAEPGHYGLGLALGNLHVTPEELGRLYLVLANHGVARPLVTSALDGFGNTVPQEPVRLLDSGAVDLVTDILSDPGARRPSFPEGSALDYDIAVAVKTGTSQGYRDGWTAAFSDRLLVVMWIGNHDWRRMNHLGGLAGTAEAVRTVLTTLTPTHHRHQPVAQSFAEPVHSARHEVCALSGQLAGPACANRRSELFLDGTVPTTECSWHRRIGIDVRTGDRATDDCPAHVVRFQAVLDVPPAYERWGRQQGIPLMPSRDSRLCGGAHDEGPLSVAVVEPQSGVRYAFDPDTPADFATIRLAARVDGGSGGVDNDVVFLVDGEPVARVGHPHEARWTITPGRHTIQAVLAARSVASSPVVITVRP